MLKFDELYQAPYILDFEIHYSHFNIFEQRTHLVINVFISCVCTSFPETLLCPSRHIKSCQTLRGYVF